MHELKFELLEGEYFTVMIEHSGYLWLRTNLGNYFKSTDSPVEHIDFVRVYDNESIN